MNYPQHIGLIPDGNRTWAKENGKSSLEGHLEGLSRGIELSEYIFSHTPVKVFTARGLSTENLKKRSKEELEYLFTLYKSINEQMNEFLAKNQVNFKRIGNPVGLPTHLINYLEKKQEEHSYPDSDKYLVSAINYGGRDEIIRSYQKAIKAGNKPEEITDEILSSYTDLAGLPNLDLVIRTKGNLAQRTSGFMSRHIGYSELYFTEKKGPDFTVEEMKKALKWYNEVYIHRNFGK